LIGTGGKFGDWQRVDVDGGIARNPPHAEADDLFLGKFSSSRPISFK
jgi:hypothetical protein